ncbi:MAG: DNA repair protein RecO, partial [Chloroflexota bacterium]
MVRRLRSFRAEAIVLKHRDYGEADRVLSIYTREKGKLQAIAKGARKVRSRKGGHLEPFTHVKLQLATGRTWYIVSQAEAIEPFAVLREDLEILGYASYIVELLEKFTLEEERNPGVFDLVKRTLARLARGEDVPVVIAYYEIRLLDLLGFRPELKKCVVSEDEILPQDQYFSAALGGVVSPAHGKQLAGAVPISMQALKFMRHFQRSSYKDAQRANISQEVRQELEVVMQHYLTYLLERGLN